MQEIIDMQNKEVKKVEQLLEVSVSYSGVRDSSITLVLTWTAIYSCDPPAALFLEFRKASRAVLERSGSRSPGGWSIASVLAVH